jgi:hypothetical protein
MKDVLWSAGCHDIDKLLVNSNKVVDAAKALKHSWLVNRCRSVDEKPSEAILCKSKIMHKIATGKRLLKKRH